MCKPGSRLGYTFVALVWGGWVAFTGTSTADLEIQKQARAVGVSVKSCQDCHVDKLPKKDSHEFNDQGKWLVAQKEKRGAQRADGAWLKDYPGKK